MSFHRFDRSTLSVTPWKNGGGVTREILCQPSGAGMDAFDWRVSIAHIASDGPFSRFEGVDRVITLLQGAGVWLHSSEDALEHRVDHRLDQLLVPFAFAGEAPVVGTLLNGPCDDVNVMTRRANCHASVVVCRGASSVSAPAGLLLAVAGHWQAGDQVLAPGQGLWWAHGHLTWALCRPHGGDLDNDLKEQALLAVSIHPVNP